VQKKSKKDTYKGDGKWKVYFQGFIMTKVGLFEGVGLILWGSALGKFII
jgi:hypothetical protein